MTITRTRAAENLTGGLPFTLASAAEGICFISGMPALDASGFAPGTFREEMEGAWRNIMSIASAAGYSNDEILYVQCVLADIENYTELNTWWRQQFPDIATSPARFTYQAAALPFGAKIEIQAVAGHDGPSEQTRVSTGATERPAAGT
jgi:2-iminobutanoate/2-iminopropanoate deaminase